MTSCCSNDRKRPHHCCYLANKVENIKCTPDIPYTLEWAGICFSKLPLSLFLEPTRAYTSNGISIGSAVLRQLVVVTSVVSVKYFNLFHSFWNISKPIKNKIYKQFNSFVKYCFFVLLLWKCLTAVFILLLYFYSRSIKKWYIVGAYWKQAWSVSVRVRSCACPDSCASAFQRDPICLLNYSTRIMNPHKQCHSLLGQKRIRGFLNDMRYINPRFTYLLTYLLL